MNERLNKLRVIGAVSSEREGVADFVERCRSESLKSIYGEDFLEPTPEEIAMMEKTMRYVSEIAKRYGGHPDISLDRIAVVKKDSLREFSSGVHSSTEDSVAVERTGSLILFGRTLAHELFHKLGPRSFQADELSSSDERGVPYRTGNSMFERHGKGRYFYVAEEAMAAEMSKSYFMDVMSENEEFKEEIAASESIKQWMITFFKGRPKGFTAEQANHNATLTEKLIYIPHALELLKFIHTSKENDDYKVGYIHGAISDYLEEGTIEVERVRESKKFKSVLNKLAESDETNLLTVDALFDLFARAHFTGNYLPLAKKIDRTLGIGTFRGVARELGVNFE